MKATNLLRLLAVALLATLAAIVALDFVHVGGNVGPGRIEIAGHWSTEGRTGIQFPPLGQVQAATHRAPFAVEARVEELDIERVQELLNEDDPEAALRADVEGDVEPLVRAYGLRVLAVAVLVGALVGAFVPGRRIAFIAVGGVGAGVVVAVLMLSTWRGYDPNAFEEPSFHGALQRAPEVIEAVQRNVEGVEAIRDRVDVLSAQLANLYAVASADPNGFDEDEVRILHVSDIHSNPLGIEIVEDLAERFDVDAVLDTGDLTSFGYPIEARVGDLIARVDRPYIFVPGNHDSLANRTALGEVANVELLNERTVTIGDVRILGVADPTFTADNKIDDEQAAEIKEDFAPHVADVVERRQPDVLAVHDQRIAVDSTGKVPLVLAGHVHRRSDETIDGTRVLTVGSTGATGLGSFLIDEDRAYEAELLHFVDGKLEIVDYLKLDGLSGSYAIQRSVVENDESSSTSTTSTTGSP